jgi:hypothetical protein
MIDKINETFDELIAAKRRLQQSSNEISDIERRTKMENLEKWVDAKNNDVRRAIIEEALEEDERYQSERNRRRIARDEFRIAWLEVERHKLVIQALNAVVKG